MKENAGAREDVLGDIEATVEGLKDVEKYGVFVQHEVECERAIGNAIQLLRAMKEVLKG